MRWGKPAAGSTCGSADAAFHFEVDEAFQFDAVFHGELLHQVVDETIDGEGHGFGFGEAALHEVEDLVFADLGDGGFVLGGVFVAFDGDGGVGVGAGAAVDEQGVALGVVFAAFEVLRDVDLAAVGGAAFADGDGLRNDVGGGVVGEVDHLGAGVLVLAGVGEGDGDDFTTGAFAFHDDAGVLHGEAGADVAVDPADLGVFVGDAAFGDEVEDVGAPVLDGDVLNFGAFHGDEFDDGGVQGGSFEFGGGAAFHVHDFGAFIGDDEGALELAELLGVDAEVGLERVADFDAFGDVDEGATGEDGAVEGAKFVVRGGDDFAEPGFEDFRVFVETFGGVDEDDALVFEDFFDIGVGGFGVVLSFDTGEEFAFLLGDAEAFEGALDVLGDFVPGALGLLAIGKVVAEFFEVDVFQVLGGPVGGHGLGVEDFESLVAEFADPVRVVFDIADVVHSAGADAEAGVEFVPLGEGEVADVVGFDVGDVVVEGGDHNGGLSWDRIDGSLRRLFGIEGTFETC